MRSTTTSHGYASVAAFTVFCSSFMVGRATAPAVSRVVDSQMRENTWSAGVVSSVMSVPGAGVPVDYDNFERCV